jgi:hypothetical protein
MKWFKRYGIINVPSSFPGWLLFILGVAYAVYSFFEIDRKSHSVSDTLMNFAFRLLMIFIVYSIISYFTGTSDKKQPPVH